ncbi:N-6 DNA methylase [Microbacterium paraoxydans]|uniref:class I SAM-dependent DNA methyltransferase n=1 Tax=Microbacterium paraoxydans TaxID=199592 RepID=UPI003D71BA28
MTGNDRDDLAARIWALCRVLRDDGVVYHKYLSELTYLLFLKNAKQLDVESSLPAGCRWDDLLGARGPGMLSAYRKILLRLGEDSRSPIVRKIFAFSATVFSRDENLERVVDGIEEIDWHSYTRDAIGEIYESLIERNANESRSGSGQYFTPRPLVNAMVSVMKPRGDDVILDPSVGTGGFLIAAHRASGVGAPNAQLYQGVEIERETYRLALMNLFLHEMNGVILNGDALTSDSDELKPATLVLANPPFGVGAGGVRRRRPDLPFPNANKQLAFLQLIMLALAPGGRAAVVVPDNVLTDGGAGQEIRRTLVENFHLRTILRLPPGIFYAAGVLTNVLFFTKPSVGKAMSPSDGVWIYDMRASGRPFNKSRPLRDSDFEDFVTAYGHDPSGNSRRVETSKFVFISLEEVRGNGYNLNSSLVGDVDQAKNEDVSVLLAEMAAAIATVNASFADFYAALTSSELPDEIRADE